MLHLQCIIDDSQCTGISIRSKGMFEHALPACRILMYVLWAGAVVWWVQIQLLDEEVLQAAVTVQRLQQRRANLKGLHHTLQVVLMSCRVWLQPPLHTIICVTLNPDTQLHIGSLKHHPCLCALRHTILESAVSPPCDCASFMADSVVSSLGMA